MVSVPILLQPNQIFFYLQAVTLADINQETGAKALEEIESEFGPNRAIFVTCDVTNIEEFEGINIYIIIFILNIQCIII